MPELDPTYQGIFFLDLSLEVPEMKTMILMVVKESRTNNQQMAQLHGAKAKGPYSSAVGLVNDGVEILRGFSKVQIALDIRLQSIVRKGGPFVKESCTSLAGLKLLKDKGVTCAFSSANDAAKKKRSKGSGRKT